MEIVTDIYVIAGASVIGAAIGTLFGMGIIGIKNGVAKIKAKRLAKKETNDETMACLNDILCKMDRFMVEFDIPSI